ncbi:MAG TPA: rod shape-determining protein MreC [Candidatus Binataceae bacterium]|nr:rod shape-determining protein MreC [Candidatus Binataceae bacterium]
MKGTLLWRYRVVLTSGALLILAAHLVSTGVHPTSIAARPASIFLEVIRPFQLAVARLVEGGESLVRDYTELVNARRDNDRLRSELKRLEGEQTKMAELENENRHMSELLDLREVLEMHAVGATVIGSDATGLSRTLVLAQGSDSGLGLGMAVMSGDGVVGRIIAASGHASRVLLIDDHNSAIDAFDQRSRARGIVAGLVDDGIIMKYVDRSQDVKEGDSVVTSGLDGIFPRGLLIGRIKKVAREGSGLFVNVSITAAVDFGKLEQVLVVTDKPPHIDNPVDKPKG